MKSKTQSNYLRLLITIILIGYSSWCHASYNEVIINGGFERGMATFEIYQYPVYPNNSQVARDTSGAISGSYSLNLPVIKNGGYKFVLPMISHGNNDSAKVALSVKSTKAVNVTIEGFVHKKRIFSEKTRVKKGLHKFFHEIDSRVFRGDPTPVSIILWVNSIGDLTIDDVSLKTTGFYADSSGVLLSSNNSLGVYGINEVGWMNLSGDGKGKKHKYRIYNHLNNDLVKEESIDTLSGKKITLYTEKRGSYRVELLNNSQVAVWRLYAVINKEKTNASKGGRYGLALEEYGKKQMLNVLLRPEKWYELSSQIGAGNVRLFTAAMPDLISSDGVSYDFTFPDNMLKLAEKYQLEPLVELGSNVPERLPEWLRSTDSANNNFNISDGIRTKNLLNKFSKHLSRPYFDMTAYESYLKKTMSHFGDRVKYYEIWNEPGHKFKPESFSLVAKLTRDVQLDFAKHASIIGFTSTKGAGLGHGRNIGLTPEFASEMMRICSDCVDILSYHSEHAFLFMGNSIDRRNEEIGFVGRLSIMLKEYPGKENLPIWDTERGIKWYSPHTERVDYMAGANIKRPEREIVSVNEVARRLPGVHAAAFASGVEKLFWFYMNAGSMTSVRSNDRFGFFDANLEPMPHLPVYDAMTEIIADAAFMSFLDKPDGTRVYEFKRNDTTVLLAFNWKQDDSNFSIDYQGVQIVLHDIVGDITEFIKGDAKGQKKVSVNGWPQYILIHNVSNGSFNVH